MAPLHRKRTPLLRLCPTLFLLLFGSHQSDAKIKFEENIRPILERSCLKCHGGEKVKGHVDFSKINTETDADSHFELWETVKEMIEEGEMPPEDNPQLSPKEKSMILDWHQERNLFPALSVHDDSQARNTVTLYGPCSDLISKSQSLKRSRPSQANSPSS